MTPALAAARIPFRMLILPCVMVGLDCQARAGTETGSIAESVYDRTRANLLGRDGLWHSVYVHISTLLLVGKGTMISSNRSCPASGGVPHPTFQSSSSASDGSAVSTDPSTNKLSSFPHVTSECLCPRALLCWKLMMIMCISLTVCFRPISSGCGQSAK